MGQWRGRARHQLYRLGGVYPAGQARQKGRAEAPAWLCRGAIQRAGGSVGYPHPDRSDRRDYREHYCGACGACCSGRGDADAAATSATEAATSASDAATSATEAADSAAEALASAGFDSFADFIADSTTYDAGTQVRIPSIGAVYEATDSTGNLGQTNAGGQEFDVVLGDFLAFGAVGDGVTSNDDAWAAFIAYGGGYVPAGTFKIDTAVSRTLVDDEDVVIRGAGDDVTHFLVDDNGLLSVDSDVDGDTGTYGSRRRVLLEGFTVLTSSALADLTFSVTATATARTPSHPASCFPARIFPSEGLMA